MAYTAILDLVYQQMMDARLAILGQIPTGMAEASAITAIATGGIAVPSYPSSSSSSGQWNVLFNPLTGQPIPPLMVVIVDEPRFISQFAGGPYVEIYDASGQTGWQDEGGNMSQEWTMGVSIRHTVMVDAPQAFSSAVFCLRSMSAQVRNILHLWSTPNVPIPPTNKNVSQIHPSHGAGEEYPMEWAIEQEYNMKTPERWPNPNNLPVQGVVMADGSVQYVL